MPYSLPIPELEDQYQNYTDQETENIATLGYNPDGCYFCGMHSHASDDCPIENESKTHEK